MTASEPEAPTPPAPPPVEPTPPPWIRTLTHLVGLGWATCELALWGGRPYPLAFIAAVLFGTAGVQALQQLRGLIR